MDLVYTVHWYNVYCTKFKHACENPSEVHVLHVRHNVYDMHVHAHSSVLYLISVLYMYIVIGGNIQIRF